MSTVTAQDKREEILNRYNNHPLVEYLLSQVMINVITPVIEEIERLENENAKLRHAGNLIPHDYVEDEKITPEFARRKAEKLLYHLSQKKVKQIIALHSGKEDGKLADLTDKQRIKFTREAVHTIALIEAGWPADSIEITGMEDKPVKKKSKKKSKKKAVKK